MAKRIQGAHIDHYCTSTGRHWRVRWRERGRQFSKAFATEADAKHYARQVGVALQVHSLVRDNTIEPGKLTETLARYFEILANRSRTGSLYAGNVQTVITRWQKHFGWEVTTDIDESALDAVVYAYGQWTTPAEWVEVHQPGAETAGDDHPRMAISARTAMVRRSAGMTGFATAGAL
jgi:hypothetical protein